MRTYLILLLITISCKSQSINTLSFRNIQNIYLPFNKEDLSINKYPVNLSIDKEHFYFCLPNQNLIYHYNLKNNQLLHKIELKDKIFHFNGFYPLNDSEIIVLKTNTYLPKDYHDSCCVIIDYQGNTKKYLKIEQLPVYHSNKKVSKPFFISNRGNSYLQYNKNTNHLIFTLQHMKAFFGDTIFHKDNTPPFIVYNIYNQKFKLPKITIPYELGKVYAKEFADHYQTWAENDDIIIISFSHIPWIYKYYIKKNKIIQQNYAKSILIDTIHPLKEFSNPIIREGNDPLQSKYLKIFYHPVLNKYIRFYRISAPFENPTPKQINNPIYGMQELDLNLNILSETLLEFPEIANFSIPYQNGLLFFNKNATDSIENQIVLTYVEWEHKKTNKTELQQKIIEKYNSYKNEQGFINYWKKLTQKSIQPGNFLIIPVFTACPSCVDGLLQYLCENQTKWIKSDLRIIIIGDKSYTKNKINNTHCYLDAFIFDNQNVIWNYLEKFTNFRLITIDENEQIIDDRILNPKDLPLIEKLLNSIQTK